MDCELEFGVRAGEKGPDRLYNWFLEEVDAAGHKIGPDYIPWGYTLSFEMKNLLVFRELKIAGEKGTKNTDGIMGALSPVKTDRRGHVTYSFFGTKRPVEQFTIRIIKSEQADECTISGGPAYEYEWDFSNLKQPDWVQVDVFVNSARFEELASFVEGGQAKGTVTLGLAQGFYAEWSPSIRTNKVKLLGSIEDQKVVIPPGYGFKPNPLGKVGEFNIRFHKGGVSEAAEPTVVEAASLAPAKSDPAPTPELLLPLTLELKKKISKLWVPLWISAGALIVSLFK